MEENQNGRSYNVSDTVIADAVKRNAMVGELDPAEVSKLVVNYL